MNILLLLIGLNGGDMPQIPFSVFDPALRRTIHVNSSCSIDQNTIVLLVSEDMFPVEAQIKVAVTKAFKTDGITKVSVCRHGNRS